MGFYQPLNQKTINFKTLLKQMEPRTEHRYKKYLVRKRIAKLTYKKKYGSEDSSESCSIEENIDDEHLNVNKSTFHRLSQQIEKKTLQNLEKNETFGFEERKKRILNHKSSSCERLNYFKVDTRSQFKENVVDVFNENIASFFKFYSGFREYFTQKNQSKTSTDISLPQSQSIDKLSTKKAIALNEKLVNINKYTFQEFVLYNQKMKNQVQDYTYNALWKNICRGKIIINSMDDFERSRKKSITFNKQKTDLFRKPEKTGKNRFFRKNSVATQQQRHFLIPSKSSQKRLTNCNHQQEDSIDFLLETKNQKENIDFKKRSIYNGSQVKKALGAIINSHNQLRTIQAKNYKRKPSNKSVKISQFRVTDSPSMSLKRGNTNSSFGSKYYNDGISAKKGHHKYSKSFFGQAKNGQKRGHLKNQISLVKMEELPSLKKSTTSSNKGSLLRKQVLEGDNPYKKKISRQQTDKSYLFNSPNTVLSKKITIATSKFKPY